MALARSHPVERAYRMVEPEILDRVPRIAGEIADHLRDNPADLWDEPLRQIAREVARRQCPLACP